MEFNRAGYEADLFNASWCTVKKVISRPFTFGIAVSDNAVKLSVLLRKYVKENQAELTRFVRRLGETHRNASEVIIAILQIVMVILIVMVIVIVIVISNIH